MPIPMRAPVTPPTAPPTPTPVSAATIGPAARRGPGPAAPAGPRRNEWADARNCKRADARQPTQCSTDHSSSARASCGPFRRLGVLLMSKIFRALVFRKEDRYVCIAKSCCSQRVHGLFDAELITVNSKDCRIFACHANLLLI